jgi:hypothetical protein
VESGIFSLAISRHYFLLWLVFKDALVTKEKMCKWGYAGDSLCLFCRGRQESREHIFFFPVQFQQPSVEGVNDFLFGLYSVCGLGRSG